MAGTAPVLIGAARASGRFGERGREGEVRLLSRMKTVTHPVFASPMRIPCSNPGLLRPFSMWARPFAVRGYRRLKYQRKRMRLARELNWWKERRATILAAGRSRQVRSLDTLRLTSGQVWTLEIEANRCGVAAIASIDLDGNWHSRVGDIEGVPAPRDRAFRARTKCSVDVVWSPDRLGVRKQYLGNYGAFLRELSALYRLGRLGMRVPGILDVDFDGPTLIMSYVPGRLLREELVKAGAPVSVSDCKNEEGWQC